jgi:hypothetical protein
MVLQGIPAEAERAAHAAGDAMWERWRDGLEKAGFSSTKHLGGLHVAVSRGAERKLAEYLAKDGFSSDDSRERVIASNGKKARRLAFEAALGDAKTGKRGGKTPFQILEAIEAGEHSAMWLRLWREWVVASSGRLALTWSAGLRELAELPPECLTDEEVAAQDPGGDDVLILPPASWVRVWDNVPELLNVVEREGVAGLQAWLRARRIPYDLPAPQRQAG